jgi:hypothetical protein
MPLFNVDIPTDDELGPTKLLRSKDCMMPLGQIRLETVTFDCLKSFNRR